MAGKWYENLEHRLEVLTLFLNNGQDVNAIGFDGMSILHYCAKNSWVEGTKYLLSRDPKPDLTITDKHGGSKVPQFVAKGCAESFFEIKRFIWLDLGKRIPRPRIG